MEGDQINALQSTQLLPDQFNHRFDFDQKRVVTEFSSHPATKKLNLINSPYTDPKRLF